MNKIELKTFGRNFIRILMVGVFSLVAGSSANEAPSTSCPDVRVKLTPDQIVLAQNAFGGAVLNHLEKLASAFERYRPDNYHDFNLFKKNSWEKNYLYNKAKIDCVNKNHIWSLDSEFRELVDITVAMGDLSIVAIKMQSYLRHGNKEELQYIEKRMQEINNLVGKYAEYKPTLKVEGVK